MTTDTPPNATFKPNRSLADMDKDSVFHAMTSIADQQANGPVIMASGQGVRIKDHDGTEYIDGMAALWCVNVGYGREEIARAGYETLKNIGFFHTFTAMSNEPIIRLADRLLTVLRDEAGLDHMSRVFFGTSGSDANDTQVKLVRYYNNLRGKPEKKKIIARRGGYHGTTVAAGSLTGIPVYHKAFDIPMPGVLHVAPAHYYRDGLPGETEAAYVDRLIAEIRDVITREGADTIAAFIAEPVMGTGGVMVPPAGYFEQLQALLAAHDILFIADEVITGFGRLGSWFGSGFYGLKPDLLTFAKGVTSGYFPLSGVVVSDKIWAVLRDASPEVGLFAHGYTYSGHPVGGAIALANLDIIARENLVANAADVGPYFKAALKDRLADHPQVGDIRGQGLMIGIEYVADKITKQPLDPHNPASRRILAAAKDEGLIARAMPFGDVNSFSPPLTFSRGDADETVERFVRAVLRVLPL